MMMRSITTMMTRTRTRTRTRMKMMWWAQPSLPRSCCHHPICPSTHCRFPLLKKCTTIIIISSLSLPWALSFFTVGPWGLRALFIRYNYCPSKEPTFYITKFGRKLILTSNRYVSETKRDSNDPLVPKFSWKWSCATLSPSFGLFQSKKPLCPVWRSVRRFVQWVCPGVHPGVRPGVCPGVCPSSSSL